MKYQFNAKEHLHILGGKPLTGTSTVISVIAKPLTWWASGMAVGELGWTNSKIVKKEDRIKIASEKLDVIKKMDCNCYLQLLDYAYKAHNIRKEKAAEAGTDRHALCEQYIKSLLSKKPETPHDDIIALKTWTDENVKRFLFSEAHCFSEKLWVGGICDAACELKDGTYAIIDFKSSREAYDSQFIQAAGYALQIEENGIFDADGNVLNKGQKLSKPISILIIFPFGAKKVEPVIKTNVLNFKNGFIAATQLYRLLNGQVI